MAGTRVHANGNGMEVGFWLAGRTAVSTSGWNRARGVVLAAGHRNEYTDSRQHAKKYQDNEYCQHAADFAGFQPFER